MLTDRPCNRHLRGAIHANRLEPSSPRWRRLVARAHMAIYRRTPRKSKRRHYRHWLSVIRQALQILRQARRTRHKRRRGMGTARAPITAPVRASERRGYRGAWCFIGYIRGYWELPYLVASRLPDCNCERGLRLEAYPAQAFGTPKMATRSGSQSARR